MVRLVIDLDDQVLERTLTTPVSLSRRVVEEVGKLLDHEGYRGPFVVRWTHDGEPATIAVCAVEQ